MNVYNERCAHGNHLLTQTLLHYRNKETLKAKSQPARTQRDEQLKYAPHVDPQQEHRENGDIQGDSRTGHRS